METLLEPLATMFNRQIAARMPARELCRDLDGRTLALRVTDTGLAMYLRVDAGQLVLLGDDAAEPDIVASGSLISLARLGGPAGEDLIRSGAVEFSGNAELAGRFRKLLRYGRPDLEEELSGVVGDVIAHGIGELMRGVGDWARAAQTTLQRNLGEYLQEERRVVPSRYESDFFRHRVNSLRDDVARLEARLNKLEEGRA